MDLGTAYTVLVALDGSSGRIGRLWVRRQPHERRSRRLLLVGGDRAKKQLGSVKGWLALHNDAVMTLLFLAFGVNLIANGIPTLT